MALRKHALGKFFVFRRIKSSLFQSVELQCLSFDGKEFENAALSKYSHRLVYGMANYRGKALTTGCNDFTEPACLDKTELMDMKKLEWADGPDYPYNPA